MNKRNGVIVGVLAIALVIVLVLWMRDRESQDLNIDLDIGAAARTTDGAMVAVPGNGRNPASESNGANRAPVPSLGIERTTDRARSTPAPPRPGGVLPSNEVSTALND